MAMLHITTSRMLSLIDYMIENDIARNQGDAYDQVGFNPANVSKIISGRNMFTIDQITKACRITGASVDFVFGFTNVQSRKIPKKSIDMLKEALVYVETDLKQINKRVTNKGNKRAENARSRKN